MKTGRYLKLFVAVLLMACPLVSAVPQWHLLGLESHSVNCITVDDMGNIIAGTHTGLFLYYNSIWYEIPQAKGLSVQDIMVTGPSRIVLAIGNGSDSDGMYEGNVTMWGPPFYTLRLIGNMNNPTALSKTANSQLVYIGNDTGIRYSILDTAGSGYFGFTEIKIPPYSFGVEAPYCADLHVYSGDKRLYAGGYDDMSMNPGNSNLLWMQNDSMTILIPKLNISALTEDFTTDCVIVQMYIGTVDSGIYYSSPHMSHPPIKLTSSPNDEKVNDLVTIPLPVAERKSLCAAVNGGVYFHHRLNNTWEELGNISSEPKCLYVKINSTGSRKYKLYAGTDKGVFFFDTSSVAVKKNEKFLSGNSIYVTHDNTNGLIHLSFSITKPERIAVDILDVSGRTVEKLAGRYYAAGRNTLAIPLRNGRNHYLSSGAYIVKMIVGNTIYDMNIVFTK